MWCLFCDVSQLLKILLGLYSVDDARFIDDYCDCQLQNIGASGGQGVTT